MGLLGSYSLLYEPVRQSANEDAEDGVPMYRLVRGDNSACREGTPAIGTGTACTSTFQGEASDWTCPTDALCCGMGPERAAGYA